MLQATRAGISALAAFSRIAAGLGVSRAVLADDLRALTGTGPGEALCPLHRAGTGQHRRARPPGPGLLGACVAHRGLPLGQYRGRPRQPALGGMTSTPPSTEATMTSPDRRADISHEGKERTPIAMSIPATMCALQQT